MSSCTQNKRKTKHRPYLLILVVGCACTTQSPDAGLDTYVAEVAAYQRGSANYQQSLSSFLRHDVEAKLDALAQRRSSLLDPLERRLDAVRDDTIELYQARARAKSSDAPSLALRFRLAELHYQKTNDQYIVAMDRYTELLENDTLSSRSMPSEPVLEFSRTIELLRQLVREHPNWEHHDDVLYMLGYSLSEQQDIEEAVLAWLALVCSNHVSYRPLQQTSPPPRFEQLLTEEERRWLTGTGYAGCESSHDESRLTAEVWIRIGDYHFDYDSSDAGLDRAIGAYRQSLAQGDSPYAIYARYKLAWSFYRANRFPEAFRAFYAVISRASDNTSSQRPLPALDLRNEARQYCAIILAEEDWDGDGERDGPTSLERANDPSLWPDQRHRAEILESTGLVLHDLTHYEEAIVLWRELLRANDDAATAIRLQDHIERSRGFLEPESSPTISHEAPPNGDSDGAPTLDDVAREISEHQDVSGRLAELSRELLSQEDRFEEHLSELLTGVRRLDNESEPTDIDDAWQRYQRTKRSLNQINRALVERRRELQSLVEGEEVLHGSHLTNRPIPIIIGRDLLLQ